MLDTVLNIRHKHTKINKTYLSLSKSLQSNRIEEISSCTNKCHFSHEGFAGSSFLSLNHHSALCLLGQFNTVS